MNTDKFLEIDRILLFFVLGAILSFSVSTKNKVSEIQNKLETICVEQKIDCRQKDR